MIQYLRAGANTSIYGGRSFFGWARVFVPSVLVMSATGTFAKCGLLIWLCVCLGNTSPVIGLEFCVGCNGLGEPVSCVLCGGLVGLGLGLCLG